MGLASSRSAADRHHLEGQEPERPQQSPHASCCCAPSTYVSKSQNACRIVQGDSTTSSLASPTDQEVGFSKSSMSEGSDSPVSENSILAGGVIEQVPESYAFVGSSSGTGELHCDSRQHVKQEVRGISETRERRARLPSAGVTGARHLNIDSLARFRIGDNESLHPASETRFRRHRMEEMQERLRRYAGLPPSPDVEELERRGSLSTETLPRVRRRRLETTLQTRNNASTRYTTPVANDARNAYEASVQPDELSLPASVNSWGRSLSQNRDSALLEEVEAHSNHDFTGNTRTVQSITSGSLFSSRPTDGISRGEATGREARRNGGRRLWDALTRAASHRRAGNQRTFSEDEDSVPFPYDRTGISNRRSGLSDGPLSEREGHNYHRNRSLNLEERRRRFRSQVWALQRLSTSFEGVPGHARPCAPGARHQNARRSHEASRAPEETNTRASISRIIMLAEALFEVLDEIHRQSLALSRSAGLSLGSLPAPDSVVESMPVRIHRRADIAENMEEDALQCHICLVEYEEGDQVRVLPCHHEYHMACIDKWLREVHRVCPLCRGDVCELRTAGDLA